MAIIKSLVSRVGIDVTYHRVIGINLNYRDKKVVVCVASYLSKEKRDLNFHPLEVVDIEVPESDFNIFKDEDPIGLAYLWLKENVSGFEDAEDELTIREEEIHGNKTL
jgi:hypothetical protein